MKKENKIILLIIIFVTTFSCMMEPEPEIITYRNVTAMYYYFDISNGFTEIEPLVKNSYDIVEVNKIIIDNDNITNFETNITTNNYFTNIYLETNSGEYLVSTNGSNVYVSTENIIFSNEVYYYSNLIYSFFYYRFNF